MDDHQPSKTEKKKAVEALQALALRLATLSENTLKNMKLPALLFDALIAYQRINSNSAKRRQAQYLGRLMRECEVLEDIQLMLENIEAQSAKEKATFHSIERWREKLLLDDNAALTAFISDYPTVDSQHLRHLIKKAKHEQSRGQSLGAYKALFRFIKEVL